ncbi:methylmalonyl Co-A mutase-associated GTPase MeaB [Aurantibacillus circumpalustris]|uniref:methylmalonyl Co-A mutase-associated GTPase MeaB n=1 Tax=Aurantibacillus circumpalustris TaxID=3036359 RepID=UPI00295B9C8F|nr:methylmalonyl Co-A mutase-associated GTPase MeaB [Aurantibacillus circumpalustris]
MKKISNHNEPDFFIKGILNRDVAILSRAITLVESTNSTHQLLAQQIIEGVIHKTGNSFRLGVTGVPGVGKSSFIESFGKEVVSRNHKLAVLAIDPSSTKSGGSILGDKTRMEELSTKENVYIRPSPSSGDLGGVTKSTYETILLCEAAGYDFIIVETVGVGQSEVAVSKITDFFLLLMLAGAGDELQGIKRGIMEMADALVITKADGDNLNKAKAARTEYAHAMHLFQAHESGWITRTQICSALKNEGIVDVYSMIDEYRKLTLTNNYFSKKRKDQQFHLFLNTIDEQLKNRFYSDQSIQEQIEVIKSKETIQPFAMAKQLLNGFFK